MSSFTSERNGRPASLGEALSCGGNPSNRLLYGVDSTVVLGDLVSGSALGGRREELLGRSALIAARDQIVAAMALIELDGVVRRLVLCPSDFPLEHLASVVAAADIDAIVSDGSMPGTGAHGVRCFVPCSPVIAPAASERVAPRGTEWVLLTSGTTGLPKLVVHTLVSLAGAIECGNTPETPVVWSTFYDIRRYGGLQILLRAVLTGASLVLPGAQEPTADFLARAGENGITHISGTPSHWRRALMSPTAHRIAPQYIRLSGEIADQAILNRLRSFYPNARVSHAFASTEAGVAFDVTDGLAGFPASLIGRRGGVEMKVDDGSLRIRSNRIASCYLGPDAGRLTGADGFVDTGDMLELRGDRYHFAGRRDGVINVGGLKVHPEEVEAVINRHPRVRISLVRTKPNPITGALVVADVVLDPAPEPGENDALRLQRDILLLCRNALPSHKVPAAINVVPALAVSESGKLIRRHA